MNLEQSGGAAPRKGPSAVWGGRMGAPCYQTTREQSPPLKGRAPSTGLAGRGQGKPSWLQGGLLLAKQRKPQAQGAKAWTSQDMLRDTECFLLSKAAKGHLRIYGGT